MEGSGFKMLRLAEDLVSLRMADLVEPEDLLLCCKLACSK